MIAPFDDEFIKKLHECPPLDYDKEEWIAHINNIFTRDSIHGLYEDVRGEDYFVINKDSNDKEIQSTNPS